MDRIRSARLVSSGDMEGAAKSGTRMVRYCRASRREPNSVNWTRARFPDIVHPELPGVPETFEVLVILTDGQQIVGSLDGRRSQRGTLFIVGKAEAGDLKIHDPIIIDLVAWVQRM